MSNMISNYIVHGLFVYLRNTHMHDSNKNDDVTTIKQEKKQCVWFIWYSVYW